MIIETHCYWGCWPFGNTGFYDAKKLRSRLEKCGVKQAFVSPVCQAICKDEFSLDEEFLEDMKGHEDFFLPLAALNLKEAYWRKRLEKIAAEKSFKGIMLHPASRFFRLDDERMKDFLACRETANLPLFVSTGIEEERLRPLALNARVVENEEIANFISLLNENHRAVILGVNGPELPPLYKQKTAGQVFFDCVNSNMLNFGCCVNAFGHSDADDNSSFDASRMVFGSMAPLYMCEPVKLNLKMTRPKTELEAVFHGNIESWTI